MTRTWPLLFVIAACSGAPPDPPDGGTGPGADAGLAAGDAGHADAGALAGNDAGLAAIAAAMDDEVGAWISASSLTDPARCPSAVAVVVTSAGTVVRGYGRVGAGATAPSGDTLYQVGSVTKVFTGLALASVELAGGVTSTGAVRDRVESDLAGALDATVTFRALASHTSGLPNMPTNLPRLADGGVDPLSPAGGYSRSALVSFLSGVTLGPPSYLYSNVGSGLLGLALSDATDAGSYDGLLRAQVTGPLGMNDTWGQVAAVPSGALGRVAQGYFWAPGLTTWRAGRLADMGVLAGGGEVLTTGHDIARLLAALAGLGPSTLDPAVALTETPVARLSPTKEVGYALVKETTDAGVAWLKDGETPSYTSVIAVQRTPALGVAVLSSCGGRFNANERGLNLFSRLRSSPLP